MTMDPNVLVALCTLALALITAIMVYFTAKNVTFTGILARISTLNLLSDRQDEIMKKFTNKYGPVGSWDWDKIKSDPEDLNNAELLPIIEAAS